MQIVQQLHTQDLSGSDSVELTVVVLNHSEELRWTPVTDRMTKAQSQVLVVSVMLADSSGPILWTCGETVLKMTSSLFTTEHRLGARGGRDASAVFH